MPYSILIWSMAYKCGDQRVSKLGLLKLKDIFSLQVSIFIHKCLYLQTSDNFNDWFILNHSKHI